ncbi:MAG: putative lipid flippase FtsW [Actinomycetota bacterium]
MSFLEKFQQPKAPLSRDFIVLSSVVIGLCITGMVMVTSASSVVSMRETGSAWNYAQKQLFAMIIGGVMMYYASRLKMSFVRMMTIPLFFISSAGLVLVLLIGKEVAGQKNWIYTPFGNLQPSEYAKLALIMTCAGWVTRQLRNNGSVRMILAGPVVFSLWFVGWVVAERDLGTPIIIGGIALGILFAAGTSWRTMMALFSGAIVAIAAYSIFGPAYRLNRFKAWFSPESFPDTYGYQLLHGQYALARGGLLGQGLGQSTEKWGALPAPHTDFILAVIGEELGIIGTVGIVSLLGLLIAMGIRIAAKSRDDYSRLLAFGIVTWIAVQTIVNVGAIVRALPITGVPLPFVSYGGSSLIPAMAAMGILLAIARENAASSRKVREQVDQEV